MTTNERFDELQFASCPTKEAEPFYWKWTEEGKDVLKTFIHQEKNLLLDQAIEQVEGLKEQKWDEFFEMQHPYNQALSQAISKIKELKKEV